MAQARAAVTLWGRGDAGGAPGDGAPAPSREACGALRSPRGPEADAPYAASRPSMLAISSLSLSRRRFRAASASSEAGSARVSIR